MTFFASLTRLAAIRDDQLTETRTWNGGEQNLRNLLALALIDEQAAVVAAARPAAEAARIGALAQSGYGDLRGLLAGIPEALLDRQPSPQDWSVRRTLYHVLSVELSYAAQGRYAVERRPDEPIAFPAERKIVLAESEVAGSRDAIVARLDRARAETDAWLATLGERELTRELLQRETVVDVRFRAHRIATHYADHTIQCETTAERVGLVRGDAPRQVRNISRLRGLHERLTPPAQLAELDATLAARAALV